MTHYTSTYQYTADGTTQTVQVNHSSYYVKTNFSCGYTEITGGNQYLPSSINVPGGGTYTISYEPTPGYSGDVTSRIAKIVLPSGGYVAYTYSGGNNGFSCSSSTVPTITRTVSDNNGNVSTWTYVWSSSGLTATDPAGNQTVYTFAGSASVGYFQNSVSSYQGSATGTPLKTVTTCYNGSSYPCTNSAPQIGSYVSQKDVYTSFNGTATSWIETKYDQYGNTTEVKDDYSFDEV